MEKSSKREDGETVHRSGAAPVLRVSGDAVARKLVPLKATAVYCSSPEGQDRNPSFIPVSVGQELVGVMTLTGQSGGFFDYSKSGARLSSSITPDFPAVGWRYGIWVP
jgi:hypothetical protein